MTYVNFDPLNFSYGENWGVQENADSDPSVTAWLKIGSRQILVLALFLCFNIVTIVVTVN